MARRQQYRECNKDAIKAQAKAYRDANREKRNAYSQANGWGEARRSAKKRGIAFELTQEEYNKLVGGGLCHYCNRRLHAYGSKLDRKNNEPYYRADNSVPCCKRCNTTFMDNYAYEEKLLLSQAIRTVDLRRQTVNHDVWRGTENKKGADGICPQPAAVHAIR